MIEDEKYSINNIVARVEEIVNALANGRQPETLDPTQAISLGVLLQTKALKNANLTRNKYVQLGEKKKEFLREYIETRKKLEQIYDLSKFNEKKIRELCLQENNKLCEIENEMITLEFEIKGIEEETKYLGFLSKSWESIVNAIKYEWMSAGK